MPKHLPRKPSPPPRAASPSWCRGSTSRSRRACWKARCKRSTAHGVADDRIDVAWTPGAFEIPTVANRLAASGRYVAVICLGAVIRGETTHDQHINRAVSTALCEIGVHYGLPVLFGSAHLQHAGAGHRPLRRPGRHHRQGPARRRTRQQGRRLRQGGAGDGRSDGQTAAKALGGCPPMVLNLRPSILLPHPSLVHLLEAELLQHLAR